MKIFFVVLWYLFYAETVLALNCPGDKMDNDWCWPTGTRNIGNYLKWHDMNSNYPDSGPHLGIDIKAGEGDNVYAIADGKLMFSSMTLHGYGGVDWDDLGGALIVEHYNSEGKPFTVLYGHVKDIVVKSDKIVRGQKIAKIGPYEGGVTHLHFGIRFPANNDGYRYAGYGLTNKGFVDPLYFLRVHSPQRDFLYTSEPARIFFNEEEYGIGWWPNDVTCKKAEIWTTTTDKVSAIDTDKSICDKAYSILSNRSWIKEGIADGWHEIFFGEELDFGNLQCKAKR